MGYPDLQTIVQNQIGANCKLVVSFLTSISVYIVFKLELP